MKKIIAIIVCVLLVVAVFASCTPAEVEQVQDEIEVAEAEAEEAVEEAVDDAVQEAKKDAASDLQIGLYADANGSYYDLLYEAMKGCADMDSDCNWDIHYVIGQGTASEQVKAVEDFITGGFDVIAVIQNSADATSECIAKCVDAGIPYFGLCHDFSSIENCKDAAGSICFDFIQAGKYAGLNAAENGITKIVNIQGVLGQGSAAAQTRGLLEGLEEGGNELGADIDDIMTKEAAAEYDGTQTAQIVFWGAGEWVADTAQKVMQDAITTLGPDGFDGVYVHNDPMAEGVIAAFETAGLDIQDYWLGSCNGREISWQWAKDGIIDLDCNQPGAFEGALVYQQIKAWSLGEDYKQYVHPYLTPYTPDTIEELEPTMIPCTDVDKFLEMYAEGTIDVDLNSDKVVIQEAYK